MSNATKHLGLLDAPTLQLSHAKKLANDAVQSDLQAAQDMKALLTLDKITSIEEVMRTSQGAKCMVTKKGIHPIWPRSAKEGVTAANIPKDTNNSAATPSAGAGCAGPTSKTKKPSSGLGLRKLITAAQAHHLRSKQMVLAAANIHGQAWLQADIEGEHTPEVKLGNPNCKPQVLAKVKQWMMHALESDNELSSHSISTPIIASASTLTRTVLSNNTQSSGATSISPEDCDEDVGKGDTIYGGFGNDGNNGLEWVAAQIGTEARQRQSIIELAEVPPRLCEKLKVTSLKQKV
ncbi:hypothetical protein BJV74DRAFT_800281 [Russula compacta]|nr:hypothetical protein BJV74DRAFT_800281 [Russula compacta]